MTDLKKELACNAEKVSATIEEDAFTDGISPDFLKEAVRDYPLRGGKRLRSALLSWSCGALSGDPETARFAAAAVEIYHNWTLVHDDIIDDDPLRRGHPATHAALSELAKSERGARPDTARRFGRDFAILAGDIQQGWAAHTLLRSTEAGVSLECALFLSRLLHSSVTVPLISGEALDVDFSYPRHAPPGVAEVERMLALKTGALLRFCAVAGAAIAIDASSKGSLARRNDFNAVLKFREVEALADFAETAGTAFQLRDDWLGVFGDPETLGKPICSDIAEGKPTTLILEALSTLPAEKRKRLKSFSGIAKISKEDVEVIKTLIRESGADARVNARAMALRNDATQALNAIPESKYKNLLLAWLDFLVDRDH